MCASAHVYTSHCRYDSSGSTQELQFQTLSVWTRWYGKPTSSTLTLVPRLASLAPGGRAAFDGSVVHLKAVPRSCAVLWCNTLMAAGSRP